jgi:hypothetical protein
MTLPVGSCVQPISSNEIVSGLSLTEVIKAKEFPLNLKLIAAALGAICLSIGSFVAGVTWSTAPAPIKSQPTADAPSAPKRTMDEEEETQMMRRAGIKGLESIGIVKECTRRKQDLNLFVGPSWNAIDFKSQTNVCETVYCYLMALPREYKLSEYDLVLNLKDGDKDIGVYNPKTGLQLNLQEKPSRK